MNVANDLFNIIQINKSNTMGITIGAGTTDPSVTPELTTGVKWVSCCSIGSVLNSYLLNIVLIVLRFTASDCPFWFFQTCLT